jgi:hypothetical protein
MKAQLSLVNKVAYTSAEVDDRTRFMNELINVVGYYPDYIEMGANKWNTIVGKSCNSLNIVTSLRLVVQSYFVRNGFTLGISGDVKDYLTFMEYLINAYPTFEFGGLFSEDEALFATETMYVNVKRMLVGNNYEILTIVKTQ